MELSVRDLKAALAAEGVDFRGAAEKRDLVELLAQVRAGGRGVSRLKCCRT